MIHATHHRRHLRIEMHQSQDGPLHPQILVQLGRNVFRANRFHPVQEQEHIGAAHVLQYLFTAAFTADRIRLDAPEMPHHGVPGPCYRGLRHRVQRAAVDMQLHTALPFGLPVHQTVERLDRTCQIAGLGQRTEVANDALLAPLVGLQRKGGRIHAGQHHVSAVTQHRMPATRTLQSLLGKPDGHVSVRANQALHPRLHLLLRSMRNGAGNHHGVVHFGQPAHTCGALERRTCHMGGKRAARGVNQIELTAPRQPEPYDIGA